MSEMRIRLRVLILAVLWASMASARPPTCPGVGDPMPEGVAVSVPEGAAPKRNAREVVQLACRVAATSGKGVGSGSRLSHVQSADFLPVDPEDLAAGLRSPATWRVCGEGTIWGEMWNPTTGYRCTQRCKRGCIAFVDDTGEFRAAVPILGAPASECECAEGASDAHFAPVVPPR